MMEDRSLLLPLLSHFCPHCEHPEAGCPQQPSHQQSVLLTEAMSPTVPSRGPLCPSCSCICHGTFPPLQPLPSPSGGRISPGQGFIHPQAQPNAHQHRCLERKSRPWGVILRRIFSGFWSRGRELCPCAQAMGFVVGDQHSSRSKLCRSLYTHACTHTHTPAPSFLLQNAL